MRLAVQCLQMVEKGRIQHMKYETLGRHMWQFLTFIVATLSSITFWCLVINYGSHVTNKQCGCLKTPADKVF